MSKFGRFEGRGRQNIADTPAQFRDIRKIAESSLDVDKKRASIVIQECRSGDVSNFMELKAGWEKKYILQYFRVTEREWSTWSREYKLLKSKQNPAL